MPDFATPEPISVTVELVVGDVRVIAGERTHTTVEVAPTNPAHESDVRAAEQVRVDYTAGTLLIKAHKPRALDLSNKTRSVQVTIELPAGSRINARTSVGDLYGTGRIGECRFKTATGHAHIEDTGPLNLNTATGNVTVDRVRGDAEITTGSGKLTIGLIDGTGLIKNSNGGTAIDEVTGRTTVRASNGDITVGHAPDGLDAKSANGNIRLGEAAGGRVALETGMGDVQAGINENTAAWLDLKTGYGRVNRELDATTEGPKATENTVELRARTSAGDITIRRYDKGIPT